MSKRSVGINLAFIDHVRNKCKKANKHVKRKTKKISHKYKILSTSSYWNQKCVTTTYVSTILYIQEAAHEKWILFPRTDSSWEVLRYQKLVEKNMFLYCFHVTKEKGKSSWIQDNYVPPQVIVFHQSVTINQISLIS